MNGGEKCFCASIYGDLEDIASHGRQMVPNAALTMERHRCNNNETTTTLTSN